VPVESLADLARLVAREFRRSRIRCLASGMFAATYWLGEEAARVTFDVDFDVFAPPDRIPSVVKRLQGRGLVLRKDFPEHQSLKVPGLPFGVDILPPDIPTLQDGKLRAKVGRFFETAYDRGLDVDFRGTSIRIMRPEDLIVLKTLLARPKDREDIRSLLRLATLDARYLRRQLRGLGLVGSYERVTADPEQYVEEPQVVPKPMPDPKGRRMGRSR